MFKAIGRLLGGNSADRMERDVLRVVRERGWTIVPVEGPLPWAYSIGFPSSVGAPEVICFAPAMGAARILSDTHAHLADRRLVLRDGLVWDGLGFPSCWRKVHESQVMGFQWMRLAKAHAEAEAGARVDIEAYQLFLPDVSDLYPWDDGCHPQMREMQPLLFMPLDPDNHPPRARGGAGRP